MCYLYNSFMPLNNVFPMTLININETNQWFLQSVKKGFKKLETFFSVFGWMYECYMVMHDNLHEALAHFIDTLMWSITFVQL